MMRSSILNILLAPIYLFKIIKKRIRLFILIQKGVQIGEGTYISPKAYIDLTSPKRIKIGKNCNIARNAMILCHSGETKGGPLNLWVKYGGKRIYKDVIIGENVFVGSNSVILPGVTVGNNTIIAVNTVVNKDVPSGVVVGGVPFKIIMKTKDMLKIKCDNFDEEDWNRNFV